MAITHLFSLPKLDPDYLFDQFILKESVFLL